MSENPENPLSMDEELKEMGVEFQLNMFSLIGAYDKASQFHGRRLIEKGMVDYIGTDIHCKRQLKWLKSSLGSRYLHHLVAKENVKVGSGFATETIQGAYSLFV